MNATVAQLLLVLASGIGGTVALQTVQRRDRSGPRRRSARLGARLMRP